MPPKKVGRKTNENKKKGNKCSRGSPGGSAGITITGTVPPAVAVPPPMPPSDNSDTFSPPRSLLDGSLHPFLSLPPEKYFDILQHFSNLLNVMLSKFGDRVGDNVAHNRNILQGITDKFHKFQQLGKLQHNVPDVNELKCTLLEFSKGLMSEADDMELMELQVRSNQPIQHTIAEEEIQFLSIEDYFSAITTTFVMMNYMERLHPEEMREPIVCNRNNLLGLKYSLLRLQQSGQFEDDTVKEVKDTKWGIRYYYDSMKSECIKMFIHERYGDTRGGVAYWTTVGK